MRISRAAPVFTAPPTRCASTTAARMTLTSHAASPRSASLASRRHGSVAARAAASAVEQTQVRLIHHSDLCTVMRRAPRLPHPSQNAPDRVASTSTWKAAAAPDGRPRVPGELMHASLCTSTSGALLRTTPGNEGHVPEPSTAAAYEPSRACVGVSYAASYSPRCVCWRKQAGEEGQPQREMGEGLRADFPVLHQNVNDRPLVYLDNAATSQKPTAVRSRRRGGV